MKMNNFLTDNIRCAAIFSPAGKPDADALKCGISLLESCGIKVKVMPHAFGSSTPHPDYLAAADDERASDFMQAYLDEETDILIASRGGYGCGRILERLDWQKLKSAKNKIVAGYSDLTALFFAMARHNCGTPLASVMAAKLNDCSVCELQSIYDACSGKKRSFELDVIKSGCASGSLIAGNLTVAASCAGTQYMPDMRGKILFLEEVNEDCYRVDRMLNQLKLSNTLQQCSGVVSGYFSGCEKKAVREVFEYYSKFVNGPVLADFPYGHELPFEAVKFGQIAEINENRLSIQ